MDVIPRAVRRRRGQWLIPLPARARAHLGIIEERPVFWHVRRRGELVLSLSSTRTGGHPLALDLGRQLQAREREIERLRAQLAAKPLAEVRQQEAQLVLQAARMTIPLGNRLAAVEGQLRELVARLALTPRRRRAPGPRSPRPGRVTEVVTAPLLSSSPPSEVEVERGADTSGQPAPGVPLESEACSERDGAV